MIRIHRDKGEVELTQGVQSSIQYCSFCGDPLDEASRDWHYDNTNQWCHNDGGMAQTRQVQVAAMRLEKPKMTINELRKARQIKAEKQSAVKRK